MQKTNAMRILDKSKIEYNALTYDASDGHIVGANITRINTFKNSWTTVNLFNKNKKINVRFPISK